MIKKILQGSLVVMAMLGVLTVASGPSVHALDPKTSINQGIKDAGGTNTNGDLPKLIKNIVNILLYILGAVAVIMIVIGGLRYTTSNGEASQVTSAKNTVLYSVVGLIVALMAYAIVNWVVDAF